MGYVSETELLQRATRLDEGIEKIAKSISAKTDLFVSYSQKDAGLIPGVIELLRGLGAEPYVDMNDEQLSALAIPSAKAALLRSRIEKCGRLMLLVTERSNVSHWTPWEVGLADGMFGVSRIVTFPLKSAGGSDDWGLREYLGTYPQLREERFDGVLKKAVLDRSDGLYWSFQNWMKL